MGKFIDWFKGVFSSGEKAERAVPVSTAPAETFILPRGTHYVVAGGLDLDDIARVAGPPDGLGRRVIPPEYFIANHPQIIALDEKIAKAKRAKKKWSHYAEQKQKLIEGWLK